MRSREYQRLLRYVFGIGARAKSSTQPDQVVEVPAVRAIGQGLGRGRRQACLHMYMCILDPPFVYRST